MEIGDQVRMLPSVNKFADGIEGKIVSFYGEDRVIILTLAGNEWALKKTQVEILEKNKKAKFNND